MRLAGRFVTGRKPYRRKIASVDCTPLGPAPQLGTAVGNGGFESGKIAVKVGRKYISVVTERMTINGMALSLPQNLHQKKTH
jgi:hypothetical protein